MDANIGAGKSTAIELLARHGAPRVRAVCSRRSRAPRLAHVPERGGLLGELRHGALGQLWRLKYPVWAMRDGYIPVYTVGMVNTRYIPVFMEYSD